ARRETERLLRDRGVAPDAAVALLTGLVDDRLMLEIDGRLLSLAVMLLPADRDSGTPGSIPQTRQSEPGPADAREPSPGLPMPDGRRTLPVTSAGDGTGRRLPGVARPDHRPTGQRSSREQAAVGTDRWARQPPRSRR